MFKFKILFLILIFSVANMHALAQDSGHNHEGHLSRLLSYYMSVRSALAHDDFKTARTDMSHLKEEVTKNKEMINHKDHTHRHTKHHSTMISTVEQALQAENLEELRMAFKEVSTHLKMALQNTEYDGETLYLQFCPMAANGKGAYWLSYHKRVANPYMGKSMQSCGVIKGKLQSDGE
jgi:Cu(I)/Ag(I) efflux system membrane fusion protein